MRFLIAILCCLLAFGAVSPVGALPVKEPRQKKEPKPPKKPKEAKPKPEPLGASLCPETITVEQRVTGAPEGWEAAQSDGKLQLAMVTFFDGPPAERASLKYDQELKEKNRDWVATWTLAPNARGYWVQCTYENTTGVLSRRLPAEVTTCKVTYESKERVAASGLPVVKHVACK